MMNIFVCTSNITPMFHIMFGIANIKSDFGIMIHLKIFLFIFRNSMSQIYIHKIHSAVAMDVNGKAFLPGSAEFVSVFFRYCPGCHIAEQLISQTLSIYKFCSNHPCILFSI